MLYRSKKPERRVPFTVNAFSVRTSTTDVFGFRSALAASARIDAVPKFSDCVNDRANGCPAWSLRTGLTRKPAVRSWIGDRDRHRIRTERPVGIHASDARAGGVPHEPRAHAEARRNLAFEVERALADVRVFEVRTELCGCRSSRHRD